MTMHVDGKQVIEGNLNAFTNPAIEAGLIHCRALLEFLGLCEKKGVLGNRSSRRDDDVGIEHFRDPDGQPLKMVDPEAALKLYGGERDEAEKALLLVIQKTNKGLAHTTLDLLEQPGDVDLLEIASRGIPTLVINYVYDPLGLPRPNYKISSRRQEV
jgi:hypothetical protein